MKKTKKLWTYLFAMTLISGVFVSSCDFSISKKSDPELEQTPKENDKDIKIQNQPQIKDQQPPKQPQTNVILKENEYNNIRIIDGDTAYLWKNNDFETEIKVRFYGIDAPETFKESKPENKLAPKENYYAQQAKDLLSNYVKSNPDNIYTLNPLKKDHYDRQVGIITDKNDNDLSKMVLAQGLAMVWYITTDPKNKNFAVRNDFELNYYNQLIQIQNQARSQKIGIWSEKSIKNSYYNRKRINY
ncbi:thermonuclease family protein [Mycoplasmopsis ciconiae]|uniref:Thermonuclease family protein n=1 Tax=Mycoplasmopsis ciconiae TaxID=561067 RepID=A0ABU7MKL8_9BACT|nr:thermonuclease family protein [Mycoplasmopsis ciconiae]